MTMYAPQDELKVTLALNDMKGESVSVLLHMDAKYCLIPWFLIRLLVVTW